MGKQTHEYTLRLEWTGNLGTGTTTYEGYSRSFTLTADAKHVILGTADPAFRGTETEWNPEEMLLASLSACHHLWYLHLASVHGVVVETYTDEPVGWMEEKGSAGGKFVEVLLRPEVRVAERGMVERAISLHQEASRRCFIANSVNFPVRHEPTVLTA